MSIAKKGLVGLAVGALGVVFGDIGTSPLYVFSSVFGSSGYHIAINEGNVFGIISLILWSVTIVVSIKFVGFIMRADNQGEGGIMALVSSVSESALKSRYKWPIIVIGLIGVSLFYGDSTITPAISVLSAVEGLKIVAPNLEPFIVPVTLSILAALFLVQRYGTAIIGRLFGPVMFAWFAVIALAGAWQVWLHPGVLISLSPTTAIAFFILHPQGGFAAMGAVVLAVTGAEALYADMGHFGREPITRAWFWVVFPALILCYMGQGALLVYDPHALVNPFLLLFPQTLQIPIVLLATGATVIASQSVISGAFSLTRQAVQLNFLPKMLILHTSSNRGGQVYIPFINSALLIAVVLLVILFGSSARLANVYGIAVSGTLFADTLLYLVVIRNAWKKPIPYVVFASAAFLPLDILFITATLPKFFQGGWFPVLVGTGVFVAIVTWMQGGRIVALERKALEGRIDDFVTDVREQSPPLARVPGTAVYISHHPGFTPLALRATVKDLHELPEKVVIVAIETTAQAHVSDNNRINFESSFDDEGIIYLRLAYGFHDLPNVPRALQLAGHLNQDTKNLAPDLITASYFISTSRVVPSRRHNLIPWRKHLFCIMERNAQSQSDYYGLPIGRTVEIESLIPL